MTSLVAFAEARVWGSTNCWSLEGGRLPGDGRTCRIRLEIQGEEKSGFHLVMEPEGFCAADTWHETEAAAIAAATSLLGLARVAWSAHERPSVGVLSPADRTLEPTSPAAVLAPGGPRRGGDQLTGPDPSVLRAGILELLALLGDAAAQERYQDSVPMADVPSELLCMWFDDAYLPDSPAFQAAFTATELDALAEFDRFYDSRAEALPSGGGVRSLHRSRAWTEIMAAAVAVRARIK